MGAASGWHSGAIPLRTQKTWFGVVLDAPDARTLAHFYERLLGWSVVNESDGWVDLAPSKDAGYNFSFANEKDYARPVWPTVDGEPQMSMHLDSVMLDPAGHPFCLYLD